MKASLSYIVTSIYAKKKQPSSENRVFVSKPAHFPPFLPDKTFNNFRGSSPLAKEFCEVQKNLQKTFVEALK